MLVTGLTLSVSNSPAGSFRIDTHEHACGCVVSSAAPSAASKADRDRDYQRACQFRWCWSDALFMAPPGYFQLSAATGDDAFADFADGEFWATADYLFRGLPDVAAGGGLFLRDSTFFEQRDANGGSIFWSRGNGWVLAGLPAILEALPADDPRRGRCVPNPAAASQEKDFLRVMTGTGSVLLAPSQCRNGGPVWRCAAAWPVLLSGTSSAYSTMRMAALTQLHVFGCKCVHCDVHAQFTPPACVFLCQVT